MMKLSLVFKSLASLSFIILGCLCLQKCQIKQFAWFVVIGLILDGIGDVVINLRFAFDKIKHLSFLLGTGFFFCGHLFYLFALVSKGSFLTISIICGLIAAVITIISLNACLHNLKTVYKVFGVIYLFTLFLMTGIAVGNMIANPSVKGCTLYGIGALLFAASDILLILNNFGEKKYYTMRIANLCLYYLGQLFIAISLAFI